MRVMKTAGKESGRLVEASLRAEGFILLPTAPSPESNRIQSSPPPLPTLVPSSPLLSVGLWRADDLQIAVFTHWGLVLNLVLCLTLFLPVSLPFLRS